MSKTAFTLRGFGFYLLVLGAILIFVPNILLSNLKSYQSENYEIIGSVKSLSMQINTSSMIFLLSCLMFVAGCVGQDKIKTQHRFSIRLRTNLRSIKKAIILNFIGDDQDDRIHNNNNSNWMRGFPVVHG